MITQDHIRQELYGKNFFDLGWFVLLHPPYSSDLASNDSHFFFFSTKRSEWQKNFLKKCCRTSPSKSSSTVLRWLGSLSWLKITTHETSSPSSVYLWSTHSFCQSIKKAVRKEQQQQQHSCCWHALLCKFWHIEIYMQGRFLLVRDEIVSL